MPNDIADTIETAAEDGIDPRRQQSMSYARTRLQKLEDRFGNDPPGCSHVGAVVEADGHVVEDLPPLCPTCGAPGYVILAIAEDVVGADSDGR